MRIIREFVLRRSDRWLYEARRRECEARGNNPYGALYMGARDQAAYDRACRKFGTWNWILTRVS